MNNDKLEIKKKVLKIMKTDNFMAFFENASTTVLQLVWSFTVRFERSGTQLCITNQTLNLVS